MIYGTHFFLETNACDYDHGKKVYSNADQRDVTNVWKMEDKCRNHRF
jgi:hypothetical protein